MPRTPLVDLTIPLASPLNVIAPEEVMPVAAAIVPRLSTWNCEPDPTENLLSGVVVPMPTRPDPLKVIFEPASATSVIVVSDPPNCMLLEVLVSPLLNVSGDSK